MRTTVSCLLITAALAVAIPAQAQAEGTRGGSSAHTSLVPWKNSVTVCLGKAKTRRAIKWLNRGKVGYAITGIGLAEVPGFWSKLLNLGSAVNGVIADRWARDTAKAYIHSGRRGAKVRVGIKGAPLLVSYPWWDASKLDSSCR